MNDSTVVAQYAMVANGSDSHVSHFTPLSIHGMHFEHGLLWLMCYASDSVKKTGSHFWCGPKHMFRYAVPLQLGDYKHRLIGKQAI
jgi:hypothetical protein